MRVTAKVYLLLGITSFITTWLFVGVFRDDEFYEPTIFLKHQPTFKVYFYSPIGMQDLSLEDLALEKRVEENAFREFVIEEHLQNNAFARLWYLPFILIQLTFTLLICGAYKSMRSLVYKPWQPPAHFIACLAFSSIGLAFLLASDPLMLKAMWGVIVLVINYWTLVILTRRWKTDIKKSDASA